MLVGDLFGNVIIGVIPNSVTIDGDLQVNGNINNSGDLTSTDAIIVLNEGELGAGVTSGFAGLEIDRGSLTNWRFGFDETDDSFKFGEIGSLIGLVGFSGTVTDAKVAFGNSSGALVQDTLFHFDDTNDRLGIGTSSPSQRLHLADAADVAIQALVANSTGSVAMEVAVGGNSSITSPSVLSLTSSGNTVITGDGSNSVGIRGAVNGSYDVYVTGTLGTSSTLVVGGTATASAFIQNSSSASTLTRTGTENTDAILTLSNGTGEIARFTKEGRFGVGGTPTLYDIEAVSGSQIIGLDGANNRLISSGGDLTLEVVGNNRDIILKTDSGTKVFIDDNGFVGIRDSSPTAVLDVDGCARITSNNTPADGQGLEIKYAGAVGTILVYDRDGAAYQTLDLSADGFNFKVNGPQVMSLNSDLTLHFSDINRNAGTDLLRLTGSTGVASARVEIYGDSHATKANYLELYGDTTLFLSEGGTEHMRVDSSGNLGIGKVPVYKIDAAGIINGTDIYKNGSPFPTTTLWDNNTAADAVTPAATFDDFIGVGITSPVRRAHIKGSSEDFLLRLDGGALEFVQQAAAPALSDSGMVALYADDDGSLYQSTNGGAYAEIGGSSAWGGITGTLANQTDLQDVLVDIKQAQGILALQQIIANGTAVNSNYLFARDEYEDETGISASVATYNASEDSYRTATGDAANLLLQSEGNTIEAVDGAQDFTDTAGSKAITAAGGINTTVPAIDSPYADDSSIGLEFDGSGDALNIPDAAWQSPAGDFSVSAWFKMSDLTGGQMIVCGGTSSGGDRSWQLRTIGANLEFSCTTSTGSWEANITGTTTLVTGTWYYAVATRSGSTVTLYLDGSSEGTDTLSGALVDNADGVAIGMEFAGFGQPLNGAITDVRFWDGSVESATVPTTKPTFGTEDLFVSCSSDTDWGWGDEAGASISIQGDPTLDSSPYGDVSPIVQFDASGDYAYTTSTSSDWDFGSGDFTVEAWVQNAESGGEKTICGQWEGTGNNRQWWLQYTSGDTWNVRLSSDGSTTTHNVSGSLSFNLGQWNHVAVVRNGTTCTVYVNGVADSTTIDLTQFTMHTASEELGIGTYNTTGAAAFSKGYISEVRIWKGSAEYTTGFTPPTSKPAYSDETFYLDHAATNQTFVDSVGAHTLSPVNNTTHTNVQAKFGSQSIEFDGSSSITAPDSADWDLGSGDFTIDMWVRPTSVATADQTVIGQWSGASDNSWLFRLATDEVQFYYSTTGADFPSIKSTTSPLSAATWHHIAAVRNGNDLDLYVDGVSAISGDVTGVTFFNSTKILSIGEDSAGGTPFTGYIEEVRVLKGTAVWTTDFTPPTSAYNNSPQNIELDSVTFDSGVNKDKAVLVAIVEPNEAITVNTDLIAYASPTASFANKAAFTLSEAGTDPVTGGTYYVSPELDLSGLTAGSDFRYYWRGANNKDVTIHATYLFYGT